MALGFVWWYRWLHQVHEAGHQRHPDGDRGEGQNHPERVQLPKHCGGIHQEAADHRCASGIHVKIWYEAATDNRTNIDSLCRLCFKKRSYPGIGIFSETDELGQLL